MACSKEVPAPHSGQAHASSYRQHCCDVRQPLEWHSFMAAVTTRPLPPPVELAGGEIPAG